MKYLPWLDFSSAANGVPVRENFGRWFGDSVIKRPNGEPIVFLHGTDTDFDVFKCSRSGAQGPGIYMTRGEIGQAADYGTRTLELAVRMLNPFVFRPSEDSIDALVNGELIEQALGDAETAARVITRIDQEGIDAYGTEVREALQSKGHDGILMVYPWSRGVLQDDCVAIAWEPSQVKLVHGNSGLFLEDPSMSDRAAADQLNRARRIDEHLIDTSTELASARRSRVRP